ncbi:hypothetical protein EniLVp02_0045 [Vibrio phage EniLVp02]
MATPSRSQKIEVELKPLPSMTGGNGIISAMNKSLHWVGR